MGRDVKAPTDADAWRVAALTMMSSEQLQAALSGSDAAKWIEAAAACGITQAQVRLGRMLLEGSGVAKNERAAFGFFQQAADAGDSDAQNMLGRCHENGWGTARDLTLAAIWYTKAANAGMAWAQYNLGHLVLDGTGVPQDRDAAFTLYMRAAVQGHERAMNLVARCFEEGWGVVRDAAAAREWFRKSADGGYFRGAFNYASLLAADGNIGEAAGWFEKAVRGATEPTRSNMLQMLGKRTEPALRDLAQKLVPAAA
jgi:TPR repeat protein